MDSKKETSWKQFPELCPRNPRSSEALNPGPMQGTKACLRFKLEGLNSKTNAGRLPGPMQGAISGLEALEHRGNNFQNCASGTPDEAPMAPIVAGRGSGHIPWTQYPKINSLPRGRWTATMDFTAVKPHGIAP